MSGQAHAVSSRVLQLLEILDLPTNPTKETQSFDSLNGSDLFKSTMYDILYQTSQTFGHVTEFVSRDPKKINV